MFIEPAVEVTTGILGVAILEVVAGPVEPRQFHLTGNQRCSGGPAQRLARRLRVGVDIHKAQRGHGVGGAETRLYFLT